MSIGLVCCRVCCFNSNTLLLSNSQDIVAIIRDTDKLTATDQYFGLGGKSTYTSVREDDHRGFEVGGKNYESFYVNCMARPDPVSCPAAAATVSEGKSTN